MNGVRLAPVEPATAAAMLAGCAGLDPTGIMRERGIADMVARGACFVAASADHEGEAVIVVRIVNDVAWIDACKGVGPAPWVGLLLPAIEAQARGQRPACGAVAFQTARPGLVRQAKRQGYRVTGWILRKELE